MEQSSYKYYLPDKENIPILHTIKSNSVVIIGANGSGKSRLGIWIENNCGDSAHRVAPQRILNPSEYTPLTSYAEAENTVRFGASNFRNKVHKWGLNAEEINTRVIDDFDDTLSALLALRNDESVTYRDQCKEAEEKGWPYPKTTPTKLDILFDIWGQIFPHRKLKAIGSKFVAYAEIDGTYIEYPASQMSDGERAVLYLASQILGIDEANILIIDEPEIHLHKALMSQLWCLLEQARPDCLFIYITHDLDFASSRNTSAKHWIKAYDGHQWLLEDIDSREFPESLLLEILGSRKDVLFVEGEKGSVDEQLYNILFPNRYVIPCGSCSNVISRTKAFQSLPTSILNSFNAQGLIDRDFRSDTEIAAYKAQNIYCLEVAEAENLLITPEIINVFASQLGYDEESNKSKEIINDLFKVKLPNIKDSQISNATVAEVKYLLASAQIEYKNIKSSFEDCFSSIDLDAIEAEFDRQYSQVLKDKNYRAALRLFNDKSLITVVAKAFDTSKDGFIETVLRLANGTLRSEIVKAMRNYIPQELIESIQ